MYPLPGLCVTPEELSFFLAYFTERYTVGPLRDVWTRWRAGERPRRPFLALTFDDAERDNFVYARPVLRRWDVRASFYAPVDHVERATPIWHDRLGFALLNAFRQPSLPEPLRRLWGPATPSLKTLGVAMEITKLLTPEERDELTASLPDEVPAWAALMSWAELRALHQDGHEVASHSMTHALLPPLSGDALRYEIATSKERLEAAIDAPVTTFCYPNGDANERVAQEVEDAGYACAVTTRWGSNASGSNPYLLQRCDMHADHARDRRGALSEARVALRMSGLQPSLR